MLLVDLLGCRRPIGVPQTMLLPCFTASNGDDLLAELVEGVHVKCGGLIGVVGAGYDDMAHPAEFVVRPHSFDVQLTLTLVALVQGDDPALGVLLIVRVEVGH